MRNIIVFILALIFAACGPKPGLKTEKDDFCVSFTSFLTTNSEAISKTSVLGGVFSAELTENVTWAELSDHTRRSAIIANIICRLFVQRKIDLKVFRSIMLAAILPHEWLLKELSLNLPDSVRQSLQNKGLVETPKEIMKILPEVEKIRDKLETMTSDERWQYVLESQLKLLHYNFLSTMIDTIKTFPTLTHADVHHFFTEFSIIKHKLNQLLTKKSLGQDEQIRINENQNLPVISKFELHFNFDSYKLLPAEIIKLNEEIARYPISNLVFSIVGSADTTGSSRYNDYLSKKRADAIATWLIIMHDVPPYRIKTFGMGETNHYTHGNRIARNRRALIYILSNQVTVDPSITLKK